jgi:hypothetical protein
MGLQKKLLYDTYPYFVTPTLKWLTRCERNLTCKINATCCTVTETYINQHSSFTGDPLYVGMDLTIASFDSISEVNMVSTMTSLLLL